MGNTSSSSGRSPHDDSVDFGSLQPQGVYTGTPDWNHQIVTQLIVDRKLAPFYRPLEDYEEHWDDAQILAARKSLPQPDATSSAPNGPDSSQGGGSTPSRVDSRDGSKLSASRRVSPAQKDKDAHPQCLEAAVYRGAAECPICFLYYPPNINRSRCCDQVICTECFVQIKRAEPTTTHLVSEPAACPYCVQENFGVVYTPPVWRAGLGSEGAPLPPWVDGTKDVRPAQPQKSRRRKSFSADAPEVVTIDHIRPDWEAKLASVRAAVARRANRRIIMRQVGDRLIPVGVTSGRVHPLSGQSGSSHGHSISGGGALAHFLGGGTSSQDDSHDGEGEGRERERGGRRFRRHRGDRDLSQMLGQMGLGGMAGQDLEELMVMEAMRLSLLEHEEQQRKDEEKRKKDEAEATARGEGTGEGSIAPTSSTGTNLNAGATTAETSGTPTPTSGSGSSTDVAAEGSPVPSPARQSSSQSSAPEMASAAPITLASSPASSPSPPSSDSPSSSDPPLSSTETPTVSSATTDSPESARAAADTLAMEVPSEIALAIADANADPNPSAPQDDSAHEPYGGETDTDSAVTANEEEQPPITTTLGEDGSAPEQGAEAAVEPSKHAPAVEAPAPTVESMHEGAGSA